MSFREQIKDIQIIASNLERTTRTLGYIGWVLVAVGVWNGVVGSLGIFHKPPFSLPEGSQYWLMSMLAGSGLPLLIASRKLKTGDRSGIGYAKLGVLLFVATLLLMGYYGSRMDFFNRQAPTAFRVIGYIGITLGLGQFLLPAIVWYRALGRVGEAIVAGSLVESARATGQNREPESSERYRESLLPFGIVGNFMAVAMVSLLPILFLLQNQTLDPSFLFFSAPLLFILVGPMLHNWIPSTFETTRTPISTFVTGGSIQFFISSLPSFRVLIYDDGIEIRAMYTRYFIPHDRMEPLAEDKGFFRSGILIRSDLLEVPSKIRIQPTNKQFLEDAWASRERFFSGRP